MKIRDLCYISIATALMCALSPLSIPIGIVPISLATFVVYLIGCLLPPLKASLSVLLYIIIGALGLPVFSKFQGGFQVILGPTGGFILGYLPAVFLQSLVVSSHKDKKAVYGFSIVLSTFIIYAFGLVFFLIATNGKYTFQQAMMSCVYPFLAGDLVKLVLAVTISYRLRPTLDNLMDMKHYRKTN